MVEPVLVKGLLEQGERKRNVGKALSRDMAAEFISIKWTEADISEHDFAEVMMERLDIARREHPTHWIFMTPSIQIVSLTLSAGFVRACHAAEHRWIAKVSRLLKPFLKSPKTWIMDDFVRFRSKSREDSIRYLHWALHCRGNVFPPDNMFPPDKGIYPDERWRKICSRSAESQSC